VKIKLDFVSNSSSTSFIYIGNGMLRRDLFFTAIGVDKNSPLIELFENMFEALSSAINGGEKVTAEAQLPKHADNPDFTVDVLETAKIALREGKTLVISKLSSDGGVAESFLCCEAFEISSSEFSISGLDNYW